MGIATAPRRRAADLRPDRHPRADHPGHPAARPGSGPRWRVRRRRDLRRRARPGRQARQVHELDPDDGDGRAAARRSSSSSSPGWSMGDATFRAWGWRIPFLLSAVLVVRRAVHPPPAAGDAALHAGSRRDGEVVDRRRWRDSFGDPGNRTADPARALRHDGRPGRGLVSGPVPGPVLPAARSSASKFSDAVRHRRVPRSSWPRRSSSSSVACPTGSAANRSSSAAASSRADATSRSTTS